MTPWKPLDEPREPRRAAESLDAVVGRLGVAGAATIETVFARWVDVVGESVAAHARPVSLRKGTLTVAVDDPAWASELRFLTAEIARRCQELTGLDTVNRVEVRVSPEPRRSGR